MEDLVSIVIPVYNVEKYLKKCIDSVINQSYKNIEIILVDDGSKDLSGQLCDEYASRDKRIKVIHKENGGLSDARNAGIDIANGKYITFIDSDDYVSLDYVEYLYRLLIDNNADISVCMYDVVAENKISNHIFKNNANIIILNKIESLKHLLIEDLYTISACAKLYTKDGIDDIRFPLNRLYEDNGTIYKLFDKTNKVAFGYSSKYVYLKRTGSITTKKMTERNFDLITLTDEMCLNLSKYEELHDQLIDKSISSRITLINLMLDNHREHDKRFNQMIEQIVLSYNQISDKKSLSFKKQIAIVLITKFRWLYKIAWNIYKLKKYGGAI